jgi:hypothetical protein
MPITFSVADVDLASFPHTDTMVITIHIDRWDVTRILIDNGSQVEVLFLWDVTRILIDNGSQVEVLFLSTFDKMGYDKKQLKELTKPLYGFGGKRIEPMSVADVIPI